MATIYLPGYASGRGGGMRMDVFISYQHQDSMFAHSLCEELERQGVSCWIAPRNILAGMSWRASIVSAVENTRLMALVFSSNTQKSKQVPKELSIADEYEAVVVPIFLEEIEPQGEYKFQLTGTHWVTAFGGGKAAVAEAARQIKLRLDSTLLQRSKHDGPAQREFPGTRVAQASRGNTSSLSEGLFSLRRFALAAVILAVLLLAMLGIRASFFKDEPRPSSQDGATASSTTPKVVQPPSASALLDKAPSSQASGAGAASQTTQTFPQASVVSPTPSNPSKTAPSSTQVIAAEQPGQADSSAPGKVLMNTPAPAKRETANDGDQKATSGKTKTVNNLFGPPK